MQNIVENGNKMLAEVYRKAGVMDDLVALAKRFGLSYSNLEIGALVAEDDCVFFVSDRGWFRILRKQANLIYVGYDRSDEAYVFLHNGQIKQFKEVFNPETMDEFLKSFLPRVGGQTLPIMPLAEAIKYESGKHLQEAIVENIASKDNASYNNRGAGYSGYNRHDGGFQKPNYKAYINKPNPQAGFDNRSRGPGRPFYPNRGSNKNFNKGRYYGD